MIGEITLAITILLTGGDDLYANNLHETTRFQVRNVREVISTESETNAEYGRVITAVPIEEASEHDGNDDNADDVINSHSGDDNAPDTRVQESEEQIDEATTQLYEVTAYTAGAESTGKSPGDEGYGIAASGAVVTEGRTIACPQELAFGTSVEIEGIGVRVCEDRGSAITSGHIDVYMPSLSDAQAFGRQVLEVEIISE